MKVNMTNTRFEITIVKCTDDNPSHKYSLFSTKHGDRIGDGLEHMILNAIVNYNSINKAHTTVEDLIEAYEEGNTY
jgi:hypothetical protein